MKEDWERGQGDNMAVKTDKDVVHELVLTVYLNRSHLF